MIPLLLEELPTAKEFKDAIKSLSPEQQRFAKAYRSMQLESSVFGICVVQIKPQLEALLSLPPNSLDKEMKLTQDLMELFVEYQVPSDLLSYNGATDDVAVEDKVSNVREHVKSVMEVIEGEKEKHLKNAVSKRSLLLFPVRFLNSHTFKVLSWISINDNFHCRLLTRLCRFKNTFNKI